MNVNVGKLRKRLLYSILNAVCDIVALFDRKVFVHPYVEVGVLHNAHFSRVAFFHQDHTRHFRCETTNRFV